MNAALTVTDIFALTSVEDTIRKTGELAIRVAERSVDFRRDLASIASWWANTDSQPERLLAILYLRAQESAGTFKNTDSNDIIKRANRARAMLRSLDRNDANEAVAALESRIANSPSLARRLALAQDELADMQQDLEDIARNLVPKLNDIGVARDEAAGVSAQNEVTTQGWGCYLNGTRISCWLAVAIVLVAILLV